VGGGAKNRRKKKKIKKEKLAHRTEHRAGQGNWGGGGGFVFVWGCDGKVLTRFRSLGWTRWGCGVGVVGGEALFLER